MDEVNLKGINIISKVVDAFEGSNIFSNRISPWGHQISKDLTLLTAEEFSLIEN